MLYVYIGKENLPKDTPFIFDPNEADGFIDLLYDALTTDLLKEVEQAIPAQKNRFIDRFGGQLYTSMLSTSTKILLLAHQTDYIINADEIGRYAFRRLLQLPKAYVYFKDCWRDFDFIRCPCVINGNFCTTINKVNKFL